MNCVHSRPPTRAYSEAIGSRDVNLAIVVTARHLYSPRTAAHFAVLDEGAGHVCLDVGLDLLAPEWTRALGWLPAARQSVCPLIGPVTVNGIVRCHVDGAQTRYFA